MKTIENLFVRSFRSVGLALMLLMVGCELESKDRFISNSAKSIYFTPSSGVLWIVPGTEVYKGGRTGAQCNLIYLVVLCPGIIVNGKGGSTEYGENNNTYISRWVTDKSVVEVSVSWNKAADSIHVGREKFSRRDGNTFLVLRDPKGKISVTQLKGPGKDLQPVEIIELLEQQLKDDRAKSVLRLFSID